MSVRTSQSTSSHDQSHDQFEAETGQVPPSKAVVAIKESTTSPETTTLESPLDHAPLQSTGQNLSNSVTIVPHHHGNKPSESPSIGDDAESAQSSPHIPKRMKPPALDLTNATPTLDHPPHPQMYDMPPYHDQGPHLSPLMNRRKLWDFAHGEELTSSIRSLPTTFSPVTPKSTQRYLGYDPMQLPEVTLSYPELGPPVS